MCRRRDGRRYPDHGRSRKVRHCRLKALKRKRASHEFHKEKKPILAIGRTKKMPKGPAGCPRRRKAEWRIMCIMLNVKVDCSLSESGTPWRIFSMLGCGCSASFPWSYRSLRLPQRQLRTATTTMSPREPFHESPSIPAARRAGRRGRCRCIALNRRSRDAYRGMPSNFSRITSAPLCARLRHEK